MMDSGRYKYGQNGRAGRNGPRPQTVERFEDAPFYLSFLVYHALGVLFIFGYLQDLLRRWGILKPVVAVEPLKEGWVPLHTSFDNFYSRHFTRRLRDVYQVPICSVPGAEVDLLDRVTPDNGWTFRILGTKTRVMNFASYDYLGFAASSGPRVDTEEECVRRLGLGVCSSRHELGNMAIHRELEEVMAEFLGAESAITFGMGYATNTMNIPALVGKGCLILSDELNHASIAVGCKLSGAKVLVFKHKDIDDLEHKLRDAVWKGQPGKLRSWRKILIVVEGIYSMEASIVNLPELIRLKKKYKCHLYVDEAHSVGALGPRGRGVTDYWGVDPKDVDVLMGTFSKTFAGAGGYIAGSKKLIDRIRSYSHSACYATSMAPPVAQQVVTCARIIMGKDGTNEGLKRIGQLAWNTRYFRRRLHEMGLIVYGNDDSPVVPVLIYLPAMLQGFNRECMKRGLVVVVVWYPATPLLKGRARFCVSAAHTKEMLDKALDIIDEVAGLICIRYSRMPLPDRPENDEDFRARYALGERELNSATSDGVSTEHSRQNSSISNGMSN